MGVAFEVQEVVKRSGQKMGIQTLVMSLARATDWTEGMRFLESNEQPTFKKTPGSKDEEGYETVVGEISHRDHHYTWGAWWIGVMKHGNKSDSALMIQL